MLHGLLRSLETYCDTIRRVSVALLGVLAWGLSNLSARSGTGKAGLSQLYSYETALL